MDICGIRVFKECDPFYIELQIFKFQYLWKYHKYHKSKMIIIKNMNLLRNHCDPISLNNFYINKISNQYLINIDNLYPIIINNNMYIYELTSLKELINQNINEIYLNIPFEKKHVNNIIFLTKYMKNDNIPLTASEILYKKKIEIFQIFFELGTYFTLQLYENINKNKLNDVFNELKMIWTSFKDDNNVDENSIFGQTIKWNHINIKKGSKTKNPIEDKLLDNINIMINNKLEDNFKKNICYIIIGAFSYADSNIKKIYNNIDFI